jgi:aldose 1-epimerase
MTQIPFGELPDGRAVTLFELTNANGMVVRLLDYGGTVQSIEVPDTDGNLADVVLGYDDLAGYLGQSSYFGTIIGRYGNRIGGARFELDGETYELLANDGPNHLHGGAVGFDKVLWSAESLESPSGAGVTLSYESVDGEEGYPGNLAVEVDYLLTDANELVIDYRATTDRATIVNLTNHSYFNLSGADTITDHEMWINAGHFTPVDKRLIPTGEIRDVADSPFDFRYPKPIGRDIEADDQQLGYGGGYDHNYVLRKPQIAEVPGGRPGGIMTFEAARVVEPASGRVLEVETSEPGMQFYSGNFLNPEIVGKGGRVYDRRSGFCLETQHFPDSPNKPEFPSTVLRPGEQYRSRTIYRFGTSD